MLISRRDWLNLVPKGIKPARVVDPFLNGVAQAKSSLRYRALRAAGIEGRLAHRSREELRAARLASRPVRTEREAHLHALAR